MVAGFQTKIVLPSAEWFTPSGKLCCVRMVTVPPGGGIGGRACPIDWAADADWYWTCAATLAPEPVRPNSASTKATPLHLPTQTSRAAALISVTTLSETTLASAAPLATAAAAVAVAAASDGGA